MAQVAAKAAVAEWRSGVFIPAAKLYCDAAQPRDVCFLSRPSAVRPRGRHPLITTPETLATFAGPPAGPSRGAGGPGKSATAALSLAVPYGQPFTLGARRLELYRSGQGPGAASLVIDAGGFRVAYAGRVNPHPGVLGGGADVRACDALIVEAPYADPDDEFLAAAEGAPRVVAFARACAGDLRTAVLLVTSSEHGIQVAAAVAAADIPVAAHHAIAHPASRLRMAGAAMPPIRRLDATARAPVIVWPLSRRADLDRKLAPPARRILLVSGTARDPQAIARAGADSGVAWTGAADFPSLARYVDATFASHVYVTGRAADRAARLLARPQRPAARLGPATQIALL